MYDNDGNFDCDARLSWTTTEMQWMTMMTMMITMMTVTTMITIMPAITMSNNDDGSNCDND
jgi:hypothetical protein